MKKANLTQNYLLIETISQLLKNSYSLNDTLTLCFEIFKKDTLNQLKQALEAGNAIEDKISLIHQDPLFQEFFKFYLYHQPLDQALMNAINLCKQKNELKNEITKSLTYPCLLLIGVLSFSFIAIFYLQPQFNQFFSSFDISIDLFQQILMTLMYAFPILICILILILIFITSLFIKQINQSDFKSLAKWFHYYPFNTILKHYFTIKFCLYYKEFLELGYDIHTILNIISQKIADKHLQIIIYELLKELQTGQSLSITIDHFSYFTNHFKLIFKLSLSHQKPYVLFEQYYQMTTTMMKVMIKRLINVALPVLYGFIGLYIICIYSGMILPMMNMLDKI